MSVSAKHLSTPRESEINRSLHLQLFDSDPKQTGRKCDGYTARTPSSVLISPQSSSDEVAGRRSPPGLAAIKVYSIPFRMPGSQRDRQLLHYFCVQGANEFAGFVPNEFWSKTALYASQNETIVRQSLIALSALHLDLSGSGCSSRSGSGSGPGPGHPVGDATLRQYGKALRSLQTRIARSSGDGTCAGRFETAKTALICCVLFYCFESALGDVPAALNHLDNGLRLMNKVLAFRDDEDDDEEMRSIRDTLGRLDMQATFFDDARAPALALVSRRERERGLSVGFGLGSGSGGAGPATSFASLADAQKQLIRMSNWLLRFLQENTAYQGQPASCIPASVLAEKHRLTREFDLWQQRHGIFTASLAPPPPPPTEPGAADRRSADRAAEGLVQLCQDVLRLDGSGDAAATAGPALMKPWTLSSETGVVVPLFLLAMKCADEGVTARAVELLAASKRREGLYDAGAVASLVGQLKGAMSQRRQQSEELGLGSSQEDALEHWVADLLDQAPGGASTMAAMLD
ncbi:C6 zinc finger domain-containing protein [Verticillium dahliae VdLs.17]|uniref:C6 zinc finger domain-containing protein n=1 Tax=Verticillium dahliae (strain VdLs.17 / ATCC MYA-4575 / FGSC 10137) TaxID=498257 RepID=G2X146_VERDV|nr:C6 zinc finger domain-containing protein [Verticillium dahliae VdLs.17]EGY22537.1 C6 zinc finger domain-containing protein [Verticillium dahliae VdLs.17]KAH6704960.1 C6 zinc finger domain-containing protein [Verticillium dahliae]